MAGSIPCSLQYIPGALGTAEYEPPQPEGTPAMSTVEAKSELHRAPGETPDRILPTRLVYVEDLITAIDSDVQALHALADRLMGSTPEDCMKDPGQDYPNSFIHQFEQQIDRLERLRNSVRTLNERLSEAV